MQSRAGPADGSPADGCPTAASAPSPLDAALDAIEAELGVVFTDVNRVSAACAQAREGRVAWLLPQGLDRWCRLASLVGQRTAPVAAPVAALLLDVAASIPEPWHILVPLLRSPVRDLAFGALATAVRLLDQGLLHLDRPHAEQVATVADADGSPLVEPESLELVGRLIASLSPHAEDDARLTALFLDPSCLPLRRLAARLLDRQGTAPRADLVARALGFEAFRFLAPYLAYTRATHLDLIDLAPTPGPPPALGGLQRAQDTCGDALLREVIGELGWRRVSAGIHFRRWLGVSAAGSWPFLVTPNEARLFDGYDRASVVFDRFLIVAHGGLAMAVPDRASEDDVVTRFRAYNLAHADVLADLVDVAPLTADKAYRLLARMDAIVADFLALFERHSREAAAVRGVYDSLKASVLLELSRSEADQPLGAEATRLVQMFEDPASLGDVRTLHGLKRYLHQQGLRLGVALAESGGRTTRTVSLVTTSTTKVLQVAHAIDYVDFEDPESSRDGSLDLPPAVAIAAEGLGQQLLHSTQALPRLRIFCYGNEVHYFVAFKNHPAFVRIDYSPPLRGGMIDLEYYGVSKYELDAHPNLSLDGIDRLLRRLDFDVQIENTHVHARYDKERAFDLADILERADGLFRLAPYLMDVDWVLGDLAVSPEARREAAAAWADFFADWGALPTTQVLTRDRRAILVGLERDATGEREVRWIGRGPYRDRFTVAPPADFWPHLERSLAARGLADLTSVDAARPVTARSLDVAVLRPLRAAQARGEVVDAPDGLAPAAPERFERLHEASLLAAVLSGDAATLAQSARLARLVALIERGVRFRTTGAVNAYDVQAAYLPLRDTTLGIYVLRDEGGIPRLAIASPDGPLFRRRARADEPWSEHATCRADSVTCELRRNNLPYTWVEPPPEPPEVIAGTMRALFGTPPSRPVTSPLTDECVASGLGASPGRAVGLARLGSAARHPDEVDAAVLVTPSLTPADAPYLVRAAGVVSTGGGILSHAGLLAMQLRKPALTLTGVWTRAPDGGVTLTFQSLQFDERRVDAGGYSVAERHRIREHEACIREGDLLVLDADEGTLRVLGQDGEALTLHAGLRQLALAGRRLATTAHAHELLAERGRRLHARHQLEKVLGRLSRPPLARHAVRELITGEALENRAAGHDDLAGLLAVLVANPTVGALARATIRDLWRGLEQRSRSSLEQAARLIPASDDPYETLSLWASALRDWRSLRDVSAALTACRLDDHAGAATSTATTAPDASSEVDTGPVERFELPSGPPERHVDRLATDRLRILRRRLATLARQAAAPNGYRCRLRHLLDAVARLDEVLDTPPEERRDLQEWRLELVAEDEAARARLAGRRVLQPEDGGLELQPLVGSKAANLAEAARLGESAIPRWFVVTDRAFRDTLAAPISNTNTAPAAGPSLRETIAGILARPGMADAERAMLVRRAWDSVRLPESLITEVVEAYRRLGDTAFVAVRSSAREEDTAAAARAGEFDTFLFVRGEDDLLVHLRRAWSGLWTERALHNRSVLGRSGQVDDVGGGVLVQRMVDARASGVLQTVNIAEHRLREMVVNVGLGLGEGIVSGTVAADHVIVSKGESLATTRLRFRYVTHDKRERVVFDARAGRGTLRSDTLSHQRLRPALEYVELCELVWAAARLESAYRHPLDLEFALEGPALRILQLRPVPAAMALWRETIERPPAKPAVQQTAVPRSTIQDF